MSIYKFDNLTGTLKKAIVAVLRTCSECKDSFASAQLGGANQII